MSVYTHEPASCLRSRAWQHDESTHLIADSLGELHAFAASIGLRHSWFQNKPGFPHYDLTRSKWRAAVANGARQLTRREFVGKKRELAGICPLCAGRRKILRLAEAGHATTYMPCPECCQVEHGAWADQLSNG